MSNTLSEKELETLAGLGEKIKSCLDCNINGYGVPCRTDRLEAVKLMKKYLEIHDLEVLIT